jgi:hypothetical protein
MHRGGTRGGTVGIWFHPAADRRLHRHDHAKANDFSDERASMPAPHRLPGRRRGSSGYRHHERCRVSQDRSPHDRFRGDAEFPAMRRSCHPTRSGTQAQDVAGVDDGDAPLPVVAVERLMVGELVGVSNAPLPPQAIESKGGRRGRRADRATSGRYFLTG